MSSGKVSTSLVSGSLVLNKETILDAISEMSVMDVVELNSELHIQIDEDRYCLICENKYGFTYLKTMVDINTIIMYYIIKTQI